MIERLADIEALSLRCQSDQSREYIAESIQCYRAGAYRAAIVTAWIAVVFDLIDKIRELSLAGDGEAQVLESKYENYITQIEQSNSAGTKNALEFERKILEACRDKLQFFDSQQFIDLTRLREDRHRCAHPSFQKVGVPYKPSAEQARLHIRNAIIHVLSLPPVQGKAALAELKVMVGSHYFPSETDKAMKQLQSSSFSNASPALVRGFVDQLVFGFLSTYDSFFYEEPVISALNAAFEMYPGEVENRLQKQLSKAIRDVPDKRLPGAIMLVVRVKQAWFVLDDASKNKVVNFIQNGPIYMVSTILSASAEVEELKPIVQERINNFEFDELKRAIRSSDIGELAKEPALVFLSKARSWARVNEIFSIFILPVFEHISAQDVCRIIRMPTEHDADLIGATGYEMFIDRVREADLLDSQTLDEMLREHGGSCLIIEE